MSTSLAPFENHEVVGTSIAVTNAGDGLSQALKVEPVERERGETVFVLLETTVDKITFVGSKDDSEALIRQHTLKTVRGTIVDPGKAKPLIRATQKKIDEAEGREQLPGIDEPGEVEGDSAA